MKQYTKKYLFYNIFMSIFYAIFSSIFIFSQIFLTEDEVEYDNSYNIYFILIFIGVQIILIIYYILSYKFTTYELKDDLIVLKKGIIFKQVKNLKYEKMHAIDIKQNIIQKIFKFKRLAIDSGSTTKSEIAEIVIYEDDMKIDLIENEIKLRMKGEVSNSLESNDIIETDDILYKYSRKDKFYFALMTSVTALILGITYFIIGGIVVNLIFIDTDLLDDIFVGFILLFIFGFIFVSIGSYLYVLLNYYNYKVVAKKDHLVISHGLITKINHVLQYKKIKAIKVEEGFIKRLFKYATIKIEVVGFGEADENKNQFFNYLIPLCKRDEIKYLIDRLNLDFKYTEKDYKSPKVAFRYFYSLHVIIFSLIYLVFLPLVLLIPFDITKLLIIYFLNYSIIVLFIILNGYLKYKNSGIYFDDIKTIIYFGSFNKKSLIVLNKNITEIEVIDTMCRSKRNIASFNVHYFNNAIKNEEKAHLLYKNIIDDLKTKIRY